MTELRLVPSAGAEIAAHLDGRPDAPVVTFLASLAADARMWEGQAATLRRDHRVIRIDARGHGRSTAAGPYDLRRLADDVLAVWDALGVETSALVGLSLGGMLATDLALREPGRVARLMVCDCRLDATEPFLANLGKRVQALETGGMEAVAELTLPTWVVRPHLRDPAFGGWLREMMLTASPEAYRGIIGALPALDLKPKLGGLKPRTLFVCGGEDAPILKEMAGFAALAPDAAFHELPGAAHLANLDQPVAFDMLLRGLLAS